MVFWNPNSDNELANKKCVDDSKGDGIVLSFIQMLDIYLKVSVENKTNNLTPYDKIQFTDTTIKWFPNRGENLLQILVTKRNDNNNNGKIQKFIKSTKTDSPTGFSGCTNFYNPSRLLGITKTKYPSQGKYLLHFQT